MKRLPITPSNTGWISCPDVARICRAALKEAFPGIKFSVRSSSYSGGASINVTWIDGPTERQVEQVTGQYCGGRFDGMIDMSYSVSHWLLPDGSAVVSHNPGTAGQRGTDEGEQNAKPHPDAVAVRFGADHISCSRNLSVPFLTRVAQRVSRKYGVPTPSIVEYSHGAACGRDGDEYLPNSPLRLCEVIWRASQRSVLHEGCLVELNRY